MTEKKNAGGRPPKPPDERYVTITARIPPALRDDVKEWIPDGERSEVIRQALARAVAAKKRAAEKAAEE